MVPQAYSVTQPDYDYDLAASLLVALDGKEQSQVIEYDVVRGTVLRYKTTVDGWLALNVSKDEAETELLTGHVTVGLRE